ncbi:MAG: DUF5989 family protein [Desulfovibrionaceae bacterium]
MTKHRYLHELTARRALETTKQHIMFALLIGFAATLYGGLGYLAGTVLPDALYALICALGLVLLAIGLLRPHLVAGVSAGFRAVTGKFGHCIFNLLLGAVYFLVFYPIAMFWRHVLKKAFYHTWERGEQGPRAVWRSKTVQTLVHVAGQKQKSLVGNAYEILCYFARHGNWMLLPVLALLLFLGIIMFFAQTSSLAPFIYTLF